MSVKLVESKGLQYYRMYVQQRGVENKSVRRQKNLLFLVGNDPVAAQKAAQKAEKHWISKLTQEVAFQENRGLPFGEIVHRWQLNQNSDFTIGKKLDSDIVREHFKRLERYCKDWWQCPAAEITRGQGREVISVALKDGVSLSIQRRIKGSIEKIFDWAIEERFVSGIHHSPVYGLMLDDEDDEKVPPILSLEEVKNLLQEAKRHGNPWYVVWAFALLTGMRSGELYALQWSAVNLESRNIRVFRSFNSRKKEIKGTKSGYWRNVPISAQLLALIQNELKPLTGTSEFVLPRLAGWEDGYAAEILRTFLKSIGIETYAVFHTLRACFATHLVGAGVEQAKVMKIGGWRDYKTFQIYVRLSGIDEKGATDSLAILPTDQSVLEYAGGLYNTAS